MKPHVPKIDSVYDATTRHLNNTNNVKVINELNSYLKVDNLNKRNVKELTNIKNQTDVKSSPEVKNKLSIKLPRVRYVPKRQTKMTPSNLLNYTGINVMNIKTEIGLKKQSVDNRISANEDQQIKINNSPKTGKNKMKLDPVRFNNETDNLIYKTNYLLKFAKNVEHYEKIDKNLEIISDNNKKAISETLSKLRSITENKDRVLFDQIIYNDAISPNSTQNWKDCIALFYNFELLWLKLTETMIKETKSSKETSILLSKKLNDQEHLLITKEDELKEFRTLIEENDLNYKSLLKKKKVKESDEVKEDYVKKEKMNMINVFRLEEEIKDLTLLLDKDKEFYNKYQESLNQVDQKKKEIEDIRIRFNQETEERKLKIAYLNNEKLEMNLHIDNLEKELGNFKKIFDDSKKDYIEFQTKIKILKNGLEEKNENILMLTEETENWRYEYLKEKFTHDNTQQYLTSLEKKVNKLQKENTNLLKNHS